MGLNDVTLLYYFLFYYCRSHVDLGSQNDRQNCLEWKNIKGTSDSYIHGQQHLIPTWTATSDSYMDSNITKLLHGQQCFYSYMDSNIWFIHGQEHLICEDNGYTSRTIITNFRHSGFLLRADSTQLKDSLKSFFNHVYQILIFEVIYLVFFLKILNLVSV